MNASNPSRDQLSAKTNTDDPSQWVDHYGDILYRFALHRIWDKETAEDLVQDTLLAGLEAQHSFSGHSTQQTWLIGILRNKIVDHIRRSTRNRSLSETSSQDTAALDELFTSNGHWKNSPGNWDANVPSTDELAELKAAINNCAAKLPQALAQVFTLRELEQMDTQFICEVLSISPTNLWTRVHRMRISLRRCLEKNWLGMKTPSDSSR